MTSWPVVHRRGNAAELHERELAPLARAITVIEVTAPAIVLGSTQPDADVDHDAARVGGVEVARRRSGGGAVLVVPGDTLWVDIDLPRGDALWDDDVSRSFHWLGRAWGAALAAVGVDARMHAGPLIATRWSRLVCFAGTGPGEVLAGDRKVVGIAQRRTRGGARFQCAVNRTWDPRAIADLLDLSEEARAAATTELADAALGVDVDGARLLDALAASLPA